MRRKVLIVLLSLGAIGGFASGFAGLHRRAHFRHERFEERVADVCTRSAERVYSNGKALKHERGEP
jgi:hypothetical protein